MHAMFRRKLMILIAMLFVMNSVAGCRMEIARNEDAYFKDVSKPPPKVSPEFAVAMADELEFGRWVIYQDRQCEIHGCVQ